MCRERLALELIPSALVCDGTPTLVCGGTLAQDVSLRWPIEQHHLFSTGLPFWLWSHLLKSLGLMDPKQLLHKAQN